MLLARGPLAFRLDELVTPTPVSAEESPSRAQAEALVGEEPVPCSYKDRTESSMEHKTLARTSWLRLFGELWYSSETRESKVLGDLRNPVKASASESGDERGRASCLAAGAVDALRDLAEAVPAVSLNEPGKRLRDFAEAVPAVSLNEPELSLLSV